MAGPYREVSGARPTRGERADATAAAAAGAAAARTWTLQLAHGRTLALEAGRPVLMGIVNVTPDSFSDGGAWLDPAAAVAHARRLLEEGATIIDVGGESTRPGAPPVSAEEELRRVMPVVERLAGLGGAPLVSIDTSKPEVARRAIAAGAHLVNDVTGATAEGEAMLGAAASTGAALCLMHAQGTPRTMQVDPRYDDVVVEVRDYLAGRALAAERAGVASDALLLDPGIGFGKTTAHNVALLRALPRLGGLGYPLLVGVSRKSFLARLAGDGAAAGPATGRDPVSQVAHAACVAGGAAVLRVHDVAMARDAVAVAAALFG